jgi:hypothetical protein
MYTFVTNYTFPTPPTPYKQIKEQQLVHHQQMVTLQIAQQQQAQNRKSTRGHVYIVHTLGR